MEAALPRLSITARQAGLRSRLPVAALLPRLFRPALTSIKVKDDPACTFALDRAPGFGRALVPEDGKDAS